MRVGITGATGLIGTALSNRLAESGHEIVVFSRDPNKAKAEVPGAKAVQWQADAPFPVDALKGLNAVVNLAGASIAAGRWTDERKRAIRDSRVIGTRNLVEAIARCAARPEVLVNGSAIGFYGDRGDEKLTEESPSGTGFLPNVCVEWEKEALKASDHGVRVALLRTGIVLSTEGGALEKMLLPFKLFAGGPLGTGRQWMSWIHLEDEVALIRQAIENHALQGPINATSPNPVTNREFSKTLGKVLRRPAFMPTPGFALKLLLGEMAQSLLLEGQRVLPEKAEKAGFRFKHAQLEGALRDLLK